MTVPLQFLADRGVDGKAGKDVQKTFSLGVVQMTNGTTEGEVAAALEIGRNL